MQLLSNCVWGIKKTPDMQEDLIFLESISEIMIRI